MRQYQGHVISSDQSEASIIDTKQESTHPKQRELRGRVALVVCAVALALLTRLPRSARCQSVVPHNPEMEMFRESFQL